MCNLNLCPFKQKNRSMRIYLAYFKHRFNRLTIFDRTKLLNCIMDNFNGKFFVLIMDKINMNHCPTEFKFAIENNKIEIANIIYKNYLILDIVSPDIKKLIYK